MTETGARIDSRKTIDTLAELIDALDSRGGHTAILAMQQQASRNLSRSELHAQVLTMAARLAGAGIAKGDRVVLWAENSPEWIIACLAVIRCGAWAVPVDVQIERGVLESIITDAEPRLLLTTRNKHERLQELSGRLPCTLFLDRDAEVPDTLWELAEYGELPEIAPDDGATLFYTSGTTGPPKGVPLTHRNLTFQINHIRGTGLTREDDRLLLPLPLHHVYPFMVGLLLPLALRIPVILPAAMTGPQIMHAVAAGDVTVICGVPRLYRALYDAIRERFAARGRLAERLFAGLVSASAQLQDKTGWQSGRILFAPLHRQLGPRLRLLASGGALLKPELARHLEALGWQVAIGYGLTETSPLLTLNPPASRHYASVGRPLPGVELAIDRHGQEEAEEGEILARGPNVFAGYYRMAEQTAEAFDDDWFRTGDLGRLDEDGHLQILGRVSTLIVTESGENIRPSEVEDAYGETPGIREIGVLEDDGRLAALVVPDQSGETPEHTQLEQALARTAEDLPSYWRVTHVAVTSQYLPRTRLGKLRRHLLKERYHQAVSGEQQDRRQEPMPLNEMSGEDRSLLEDHAARQAWDWLAARYPEHGLTPETHLQGDLGIDSLEWLTVTVALGEQTGAELDEEAIADIITVRDLLQRVAEQEKVQEGRLAAEPLENPEQVLSAEQRRWLVEPGPLRRHLQRLIFRVTRLFMRRYLDLQVSGLGNIPEGPCVYAPNHLSSLDPPALAAVLPPEALARAWWGGWTGIAFRNPLVKALSRLGNLVPIDPERAVQSSLAFGAAVLRDQRSLVWFPEGHRSPDGELQEFKAGLGLLLERYPTPVLPISIEGTGALLPIGGRWPRRGMIRIVIGEPQNPRTLDEDRPSPQEKARAIAGNLREEVRRLQKAS